MTMTMMMLLRGVYEPDWRVKRQQARGIAITNMSEQVDLIAKTTKKADIQRETKKY